MRESTRSLYSVPFLEIKRKPEPLPISIYLAWFIPTHPSKKRPKKKSLISLT